MNIEIGTTYKNHYGTEFKIIQGPSNVGTYLAINQTLVDEKKSQTEPYFFHVDGTYVQVGNDKKLDLILHI